MKLKESAFVTIRTAVPRTHAAAVRKALGDAGAGRQGTYTHCSGSVESIGRFIPSAGSRPAIGTIGTLEEVPEEIIEMRCHVDDLARVLAALRAAHPYEEPPIDVLKRYEPAD